MTGRYKISTNTGRYTIRRASSWRELATAAQEFARTDEEVIVTGMTTDKELIRVTVYK